MSAIDSCFSTHPAARREASFAAEQTVLAGLLHHEGVAREIRDLPAEAFADPVHQDLFWRLLVDDPDAWATSPASPIADASSDAVGHACAQIRHAWAERMRGAV